MFGGGVVATLLEVGLHLVLHLSLVQVPGVLLLGVLARRGVRGPGNLKQICGKLGTQRRVNTDLINCT